MALHVTLLIASLIMAVISWYRWEINRTAGVPPQGSRTACSAGRGTARSVSGWWQSSFLWISFLYWSCPGAADPDLSLSIPLKGVAPQYFYLIPGIPLLAAIFVAAKMAGFRRSDIYLTLGSLQNTWKNWKVQLAIALLGFPLGFMEYSILHPEPIVSHLLREQL